MHFASCTYSSGEVHDEVINRLYSLTTSEMRAESDQIWLKCVLRFDAKVTSTAKMVFFFSILLACIKSDGRWRNPQRRWLVSPSEHRRDGLMHGTAPLGGGIM